MPRITRECETRIKESADIVELIGRYVQLKRSGYSWKACCPFHNEKTPSFCVTPARQSFHCFGCGVGGDALKFLMMYENLDYPTALHRLADMNGIPVIEEEESPEIVRERRMRSHIIRLNELAAQYYHTLLCRSQAAEDARNYLRGRGINLRTAKNWQLGWAPPDFREFAQLAASRGFDAQLQRAAYLLNKAQSGEYPVFRDRLMFPIRNVRGEVVGFSGRVMQADRDPRKYVNTAETPAFRKGELLFGLCKATTAIAQAGMTAIICEGQLDVIACHENAGLCNAVAGLGTAFTDEQAHLLAKYARKAILCYDGDNAGRAAAEKAYRKLTAAGLDVYQADLPAGEDPDSLTRSQGAELLRNLIRAAVPFLENCVRHELTATANDPVTRAAFINSMADLAALIPDRIRRDLAAADLATRLNVGLEDFRTTIEHAVREHDRSSRAGNSSGSSAFTRSRKQSEDATSPVTKHDVVPMHLHPALRSLVSMAISSKIAQEMLIDRIEELQECVHSLPGGVLLQHILEAVPDPTDTAACASLAAKLAPEEGAALALTPREAYADDDIGTYVEQACAAAAEATLRAKIDRLRGQLRNPSLSTEQIHACTGELQRLHKLLSSSGERLL